jgi:hypothetical protein
MTKSTIAKLWWGGLAGIAAGFIIAAVSVGLMMAFGGTLKPAASGQGYDFVPNFDPFFWWTVAFIVLGSAVAIAGGIIQFVGWIGALVNSWRLPEKTWFVLLLILGLIGHVVGLVMMIVYLLAGPDSTKLLPAAPAAQPAPPGRMVAA